MVASIYTLQDDDNSIQTNVVTDYGDKIDLKVYLVTYDSCDDFNIAIYLAPYIFKKNVFH